MTTPFDKFQFELKGPLGACSRKTAERLLENHLLTIKTKLQANLKNKAPKKSPYNIFVLRPADSTVPEEQETKKTIYVSFTDPDENIHHKKIEQCDEDSESESIVRAIIQHGLDTTLNPYCLTFDFAHKNAFPLSLYELVTEVREYSTPILNIAKKYLLFDNTLYDKLNTLDIEKILKELANDEGKCRTIFAKDPNKQKQLEERYEQVKLFYKTTLKYIETPSKENNAQFKM